MSILNLPPETSPYYQHAIKEEQRLQKILQQLNTYIVENDLPVLAEDYGPYFTVDNNTLEITGKATPTDNNVRITRETYETAIRELGYNLTDPAVSLRVGYCRWLSSKQLLSESNS